MRSNGNTTAMFDIASVVRIFPRKNPEKLTKLWKLVFLIFFIMDKELCQWQLIGCYHFVMFITYNQLMWVFKVLFGYDRTPNKSVQPHFGSTNTNCTGLTDRQTHTQTFHENPHFVSVKGKTKKAVAFGLFVYPNFRRLDRGHLSNSQSRNPGIINSLIYKKN